MQPVHLIVLTHGLYGTPDNFAVLASELPRAYDDLQQPKLPIVVYITISFTGSKTWDGVDVNAHRAAEEVGELSWGAGGVMVLTSRR